MSGFLRDCPWCGMPIGIVSEWTWRDNDQVTGRCPNGHWFGGPKDDLEDGNGS